MSFDFEDDLEQDYGLGVGDTGPYGDEPQEQQDFEEHQQVEAPQVKLEPPAASHAPPHQQHQQHQQVGGHAEGRQGDATRGVGGGPPHADQQPGGTTGGTTGVTPGSTVGVKRQYEEMNGSEAGHGLGPGGSAGVSAAVAQGPGFGAQGGTAHVHQQQQQQQQGGQGGQVGGPHGTPAAAHDETNGGSAGTRGTGGDGQVQLDESNLKPDEEEVAQSVAEARQSNCTVCLANLTWWTTDAEVEAVCAEFGKVSSVRFLEDRFTGKSKGCAYVEFAEAEAAAACKENLQGRMISGRSVVVTFANGRGLGQAIADQQFAARGGAGRGGMQGGAGGNFRGNRGPRGGPGVGVGGRFGGAAPGFNPMGMPGIPGMPGMPGMGMGLPGMPGLMGMAGMGMGPMGMGMPGMPGMPGMADLMGAGAMAAGGGQGMM